MKTIRTQAASLVSIVSLVLALAASTFIPTFTYGKANGTASATPACQYPVATSPAAGTTTIYSAPIKYTTLQSGDVLASAIIASGTNHLIALGGNFPGVVTPDGVKHPAANLVVLNQLSGSVVYAATSANSYVRALSYDNNGTLYVGGDFTSLNGVARNHIAAINISNWSITSWNPGSAGIVRAIASQSTGAYPGVYYGGDSNKLYAVKPVTGAPMWTAPTSGGSIKALLLSPVDGSGLFVGGLFEQVSTLPQHGLMEIFPAPSGTPYPNFHPILQADDPTSSDNGEENLSMAWDRTDSTQVRLIIGDGGSKVNIVHSLNPKNGSGWWARHTEGDAQAVAMVGNTVVTGYHRNHYNSFGCPYPYYSTQFSQSNGTIQSYWDSKLTGIGNNADHGNNGVQSIAVDPSTKRLFLLGAFTTYGASCNLSDPKFPPCTGGTPLQGIALFPYR